MKAPFFTTIWGIYFSNHLKVQFLYLFFWFGIVAPFQKQFRMLEKQALALYKKTTTCRFGKHEMFFRAGPVNDL